MFITRLFSCALTLTSIFTGSLQAAQLTVKVSDSQGIAIEDAVVELITSVAIKVNTDNKHHEMSQKNRTFLPFVLAVTKGAKVDFPNLDRTRHHVYSFSEAKPFELKLYIGKTEAPILFDKPGLVALGCNIHDYMQAFIYVADGPLLEVTTDNGNVVFDNLELGEYQVKVWHPWQKNVLSPLKMNLNTEQASLPLTLDIEHQAKPSAPAAGFGEYMPEPKASHAK
jgi:plastocyanin